MVGAGDLESEPGFQLSVMGDLSFFVALTNFSSDAMIVLRRVLRPDLFGNMERSKRLRRRRARRINFSHGFDLYLRTNAASATAE